MGKLIIENIPDTVLDEVQNFFQAVINDDVRDMLDNAGYGHEATKVGTWNLHSQSEAHKVGIYGTEAYWGGMVINLIKVYAPTEGDTKHYHLIGPEMLLEAMGDPNDFDKDAEAIDNKIYFYVDYETWVKRENMTNEDWLAYLKNAVK